MTTLTEGAHGQIDPPDCAERASTSSHDPLQRLEASMLEALDLVAVALECSVEALERQDVALAQMVVGDDDYTDARYAALNADVVTLLGGRPLDPVEVRTAMALLRISRHVERIGDHCVNLAKLVPLNGHFPPTDLTLLHQIGRMGGLAHAQLWQAKVALADRDVQLAEDLVERDQELNHLNRVCFRLALRVGENQDAREWGMHMVLAARWLERIGDNAVDIGEAAAFIATGAAREFTSAADEPVRTWTPR